MSVPFIAVLAGAVALLTSLTVASRPAAVLTGRVALASTFSGLFQMMTRFANLFYLPLLAMRVDLVGGQAVDFQWVVGGAALGTLGAWLLLPSFIEITGR